MINQRVWRADHGRSRHRECSMTSTRKDPFDRLLGAQANVEGIPLVRADTQLDAYGVTRIW
jgi:PIN domain nuclease of toxin-antitoxin system